jgi:signal transduction histidine kinase
MSLRLRLTLWNVGILTLAFLVLGATLRASTARRVRDGIYWQLRAPTQNLPLVRAAMPIDNDDPNAPQEPPPGGPPQRDGRLMGRPPRPSFQPGFQPEFQSEFQRPGRNNGGPDRPPPPRPPLFSSQGNSLFNDGKAAPYTEQIRQAALTHKESFVSMEGEFVYTYPFLSKFSQEWEFYQNTASGEPVGRAIQDVTRDLVTVLPFALLLAGIGGLFLTQRVLSPLRLLTEATARIGANDLSERLPVTGTVSTRHQDEIQQLAVTFNDMLERLQIAFEQQKRFVADASHELRSPLTVIKTSAELGKTEANIAPETRSLFERIDRAADRTTRLVQNLLVLARGDANNIGVMLAPIAVESFFAGAIEEAKARRPESAPIHVEITPRQTFIGDAALLHQVLVNLLDNALRHTPTTGTVTLSAQESGFTVTDTGTGVPIEHLPHLGERFYRVDAARARNDGGTGLGLSICRSILNAHHGTLTFLAPPAGGTQAVVAWEVAPTERSHET